MNTFQHPQWGILITPNKCGSTYAQHMIPKQYHVGKHDLSIKSNTIIWGIVRDPVSWYVSGWRYAKSHLIAEARQMNYNLNFDDHLEYCIEQKEQQKNTSRMYNQFDRHTWYNPLQQCLDTTLRVNKLIKLENQSRYNQVIEFFSDGKDPEDPKNVNDGTKSSRHGSEYTPMPELTGRAKKLLYQLDDWSARAGYNLDESIKNYINTLCY